LKLTVSELDVIVRTSQLLPPNVVQSTFRDIY